MIDLNRPLPAPARDIALLLSRIVIAVVMLAHGYQKLFINGISRTTDGFESMSIPLAIVSASFVTVVELVGSTLLILGAMTPVMCALILVVTGGAAVFVHIPNGIFVTNGGWELVGVISAGVVAIAAVGPGRYSLDHLITTRREQQRRELSFAQAAAEAPSRPHPSRAAARGIETVPAARVAEAGTPVKRMPRAAASYQSGAGSFQDAPPSYQDVPTDEVHTFDTFREPGATFRDVTANFHPSR